MLAEAGEDVVEVRGEKRTRGAKSDRIEAIRAARTALAREHQATPRARGLREALRQILVTRQGILVSRTKAINELKSLIVVAPEHLRASLRGIALDKQLRRISELDSPPTATIEHRATVLTLRSIAARVQFLRAQTAELDRELGGLVNAHPAGPALLAEPGVGPVVAAQLLVSWSHRGSPQRGRVRLARRLSRAWKPAADRDPGTGSTAAATATSIARSTRSRLPGFAATPSPGTTKRREPHRARHTVTCAGHSRAPSPDASTG